MKPQIVAWVDACGPVRPAEIAGVPVEWLARTGVRRRGKDLVAAARRARSRGFTHLLTLDGGEPGAQIAALVRALHADPESIVVGRRPAPGAPGAESGSTERLHRLFIRLACGADLADVRSRLFAWPVAALAAFGDHCREHDFAVETVVRSVWAGLNLVTVDVDEPAPPAERRSGLDRLRTLATYARLGLRNVNPWPHRRLFNIHPDAVPFSWRNPLPYWRFLHHEVVYRKLAAGEQKLSLRHPLRSLKLLHLESTSPKEISLACMLGIFLGALPLIALHTVAIVFYATRLRLNRAIAFYASNLCAPIVPPFVPALDIEVGHFLRHGRFLTAADLDTREELFRTLCAEAHLRLWEYLLGSLVVGPVLALLVGGVVYLVATRRRAGGAP